ncbi:MAG TPA: class I SAM-dependent methyltransferase [Microvirga sp.]|nr:class I SAM-dependent methyltransferase [Microvirga sp.]
MARLAPQSDPAEGHSGRLARSAYDALAPFYDSFTRDYEYEAWLEALELLAKEHGLRGREVLDVGCGTGKSFVPLLRRGYRVTACDISAEMVERARKKADGAARVIVADMRSLPWVERFDLITCLDDAINYLLSPAELEAALTSMWAALRPGGVLIFDANSLSAYRDAFAATFERHEGRTHFSWQGEATPGVEPGSICAATLDVVEGGMRIRTRHVQRHWPVAVLRAAALGVGFENVVLRGQVIGGRLVGDPDESRHTKVVCLAARSKGHASTDPRQTGAMEVDA